MHRTFSRLTCTAVAAALALPGVASAKIIEVGVVGTAPVPSCPTSPCEVISRTTAYQFRVGAKRNVFVAPADGRIVAWTVTLGAPGKKQRAFFEENLGGVSQAGITVLKPGERYFGRVTAASPLAAAHAVLRPDGAVPAHDVAQVKKGYIVALNVPTWAPALALGLARTSLAGQPPEDGLRRHPDPERADGRDRPRAVQVRLPHGAAGYSATMITTPVPPEPPKPPKKKTP